LKGEELKDLGPRVVKRGRGNESEIRNVAKNVGTFEKGVGRILGNGELGGTFKYSALQRRE